MKRANIIAKGRVQKVGYRDSVEDIARRIGLVGYVENLKPYDVRIVAEGEKEQIEEFIEQIGVRKWPIEVTDLDVSYEKPTGEFEYFEIRRGDWTDELGERLDTAGKYLYKSVELGEKSVELGEKSVELGEKSVELGEKMIDKQDQTINSIDTLDTHMNQRFDNLDEKYGKISENMEKLMESMDNTSKKTGKVLEALVQQQGNFTDAINGQTKAILALAEKK